MAEILFEADVDLSKLQSQFDAALVDAKKWANDMQRISQTPAFGYENIGKKDPFTAQKQYINTLISQMREIDSFRPEIKIQHADSFKELGNNVLIAKNNLRQMEMGVGQTTKGLGSFITTTALATGALAVAGAAIATFTKVMNYSRDSANNFKAIISGAKGALDGFFFSIKAGDMGNLVSNMANGAKTAKEFTEEIQRYQKVKESDQVNDQMLATRLDVYLAAARDQRKTLVERQEAYHNYVKAQRDDAEADVANAQANLDKLVEIANKRKDLQADWIKGSFGELTRKQTLLAVTLPDTNQDLIDKFKEQFKVLQDIKASAGDYYMPYIPNAIDSMKKAMEKSLPAGVSFNDMMMVAALNGALEGKALDNINASAKNLIGEQGSLWKVGVAATRTGNALGLDLKEGSLAKLKQDLAAYTLEYERAATKSEQIAAKKKMDDKQLEIDNTDIETVRKKAKDQIDYEKATAKEIVDGKQEMAQQELDIEKTKGKAILDADGENAKRLRAQAELDFQKKIIDIHNQQVVELEAYNKSPKVGGIKNDHRTGSYTTTLPAEQQEILNKKAIKAEEDKNAKILEINEGQRRELMVIRREIAADMLTDQDKELASVKQFYEDKQIELNKIEASPRKTAAQGELEMAKQEAVKQVRVKYGVQELDFEQELETKKNAIHGAGLLENQKQQEADYQVYVKYTKLKIALLLIGGTPEQIKQAALLKADLDKATQDQDKGLQAELVLRNAILENVGKMSEVMADLLGMTKEEGAALGNMMQGLAKGAQEGGWAGYIAAFAQEYITALISIFDKSNEETDKYAAKLEYINVLLERNQKLIDQSLKSGGAAGAYEARIKLLNDQIATITAEYKAQFAAMQKSHNKWINAGPAPPPPEVQAEIIADATEQAKADLEAAEADYQAFLAGGLVSNDVADSLRKGFEDGKRSAADFAETFNGFMTTAINAALEEASKPEIAAWYKKLAEDMQSAGGLDTSEVADLKASWEKIVADNQATREAAYKVAGISPNANIGTPAGLSGGIQRQITEETGTELAGLMRKIADDNRQNRDYNKLSVDHLINIEANTYNTVEELKLAVVELQGINKNTTKQYTMPI